MLQYDLDPGFDLTTVNPASASQVLQAINLAAPKTNIGFVIYGSTTPDVTNNPRFARYLWIDTSTIGASTQATPKYYNTTTSAWAAVTVPADSIDSTLLRLHASSVAIQHMIKNSSGVVPTDATLADKVLVYDSSGQYVTQITKASLLASLSITLTQISTSGSAANQVIKNVGGVVSWANINLATDPLDGVLPLNKLAISTNGFVLQMVAGVPTWVSNDDAVSSFLPAGTATVGIAASKMKLLSLPLTHSRMNGAGTAWEEAAVAVVQTNRSQVVGAATGTTVMPFDTSIPQYTEGNDTNLLAGITPKNASSIIEVECVLNVSQSDATARQVMAALFSGSATPFEAGTPNALAVSATQCAQNNIYTVTLKYRETAGSTAIRIYGVRWGMGTAGTVRLNTDGTNNLGGVLCSYLSVKEIR